MQQLLDMPVKTPKVNQANEFREIAKDFANPLELVREAISNSFDANAKNIHLIFNVTIMAGEEVFKILVKDDGDGMDENDLENFCKQPNNGSFVELPRIFKAFGRSFK